MRPEKSTVQLLLTWAQMATHTCNISCLLSADRPELSRAFLDVFDSTHSTHIVHMLFHREDKRLFLRGGGIIEWNPYFAIWAATEPIGFGVFFFFARA